MKTFSLLIVLLFSGVISFAQSQKIGFEHLNMRNGLPSEAVGDILQDDKGYIWLSTQNGLTRFDGFRAKIYQLKTTSDKNSFDNVPSAMFLDGKKRLVTGTYGGNIFRYNAKLDSMVLVRTGKNQTAKGVYAPLTFSDKYANLWIYYVENGGILAAERYDPLTGKTRKFDPKQDKNHLLPTGLQCFYRLPGGDFILGTKNGLYTYDYRENRFAGHLVQKDSLKQLVVQQVFREQQGDMVTWFLAKTKKDTTVTLYGYNMQTGALKPYATLPGAVVNGSLPVPLDKKGRLVLMTDKGLFLYDKTSHQKTDYPYPANDALVKDQGIRDLTVDSDNVFWIATSAGLLSLDPATGLYHRYTANQSDPYALGHKHVLKVFIDRAGVKWVGMDEYGVDRIETLHVAFSGMKNNPDQPNSYPENATDIAAKAGGGYWIASQDGLFEWDGIKNHFTKITPPGKNKDAATSNTIVLADGTLCYIDEKGWNMYSPNGKIKTIANPGNAGTRAIYKDRQSNIWMITDKGNFNRFDIITTKFEQYAYVSLSGKKIKPDSLSFINSSEIYQDGAGTVWLSNSKFGLGPVNVAKRQVLVSPALQGRVFSDVNKMYEDKAGNFWLGTLDNGFWLFDRRLQKLVKQIKDEQGILENQIRSVAEDRSGNLWIGSQRGLIKFNYKTGRLKGYTVADNIPLEVPVKLATEPGGRFIFLMFNSLLTFNPDDIKINTVPPLVQIESVVYSNPKKEKSEHLINAFAADTTTLAYNNNQVTFNYVALHFVNPAKNKYAYRLDGIDNNWIEARTQRWVTYNNLGPGTYTFRVKAANSDGVWNNTGASYTIIIETAWWLRWWAWLGYAIITAAAISGFIAYRSRRLIAENKILEQRIAKRTGQLSEANEELQAKQEEITSQRDQLVETVNKLQSTQTQLIQSEKMASLGELTAGIAHEIQNPLNFVNNFSEVSIELLEEMEADLKNGDQEDAISIAADIRQNLEKIGHHGKRADAIVKNMLQHSRNNSGERRPTNVNSLADEYLRLAYHGLRAKDKTFNADLVTNFAPDLPEVNIIGQDIGRVLLNLYNNAFYAVQQKQLTAGPGYKPKVEIITAPQTPKGVTEAVTITVRDNGNGIPDAIKNKIMQPFFTTKPTGDGTGLGLSLSYDIVVKGHGGNIGVISTAGEGAALVVTLLVG
ncbi:sensor histidine kinase [Mucilaginibacter flavidus]|uniref:sensor histidine kinase n=1 Tax=Mucilaginibacter flavidus TaxID=2949309 RepID=UPI002092918F|nr:two-component regulator propeller domain-containing protein [Mucilaginibacter flavidus]MCO5947363.1 ATP-binding protein [Mucilaginibacter flavidus]